MERLMQQNYLSMQEKNKTLDKRAKDLAQKIAAPGDMASSSPEWSAFLNTLLARLTEISSSLKSAAGTAGTAEGFGGFGNPSGVTSEFPRDKLASARRKKTLHLVDFVS